MAEALLAQEHHDYLMQIREMELLQLDELHHGPIVREMSGVGVSDSYNQVDTGINIGGETGSDGRSDNESADTSAVAMKTADGSNSAQQKVFSFANITQVRLLCLCFTQYIIDSKQVLLINFYGRWVVIFPLWLPAVPAKSPPKVFRPMHGASLSCKARIPPTTVPLL